VVLILAILGASVYGLSRRPASLPEVEYYNWIVDEAKLLDPDTEATIEKYNTIWNDKYYAVVAVAAVENIRGWKSEDFVYDLGEKWGLGANDMLLLIVEDGHYYVGLGDNLLTMTDTQESKLRAAIEEHYYDGDFDAAAVSFFRQADVFYAQMAASSAYTGPNYEWVGTGGSDRLGMSIFGVILVVAVVFLVWAMLDKVRYNRYQRRVRVTPGIVYYPVFWGRPRRVVPPVRPVAPTPPPRPSQPTYRPSGGSTVYRSNSRPASRPANRPSNRSSSGRSSFGNGGFGGGSRSGGSSRGSSRGGSRGGGFGGRR
jgi:uncharacterized membrane protein YgcG